MSVPVKQSVQITFAGGLNLKDDPWQIDGGEFLALNNMVFTTGGRLTKRNGYGELGTGTVNTPSPSLTYSVVPASLNSAKKCFAYNNELLINDAWNLYSYRAENGTWDYKGRSTIVGLATSTLQSNANDFAQTDCAVDTVNNLRFSVFAINNSSLPEYTVYYSIQDIATGNFIANYVEYGTNHIRPRVISSGGKTWIYAINQSNNDVYYQAFNGAVASGSFTSLVTAPEFYDVDVDPNSGNLYIAYYNSGTVSISLLNSSMAIVNTQTASESAANGVSWFGDGTYIWVLYNTGSLVGAFVVNNACTSTKVAATTIDSTSKGTACNNVTGVWSSVLGKAFIFYDPLALISLTTFTSSADMNFNTATISGSSLVLGTAQTFIRALSLNSKAFQVSGIPHVMGLYTLPTQNPLASVLGSPLYTVPQATHFLLNLYNLTPNMVGSGGTNDTAANLAAKVSPDEAVISPPFVGYLSGIHQTSSGIWEMALLQNSNYGFSTNGTSSSLYVPNQIPTGSIDCQFNFNLTNPDVQSLGNNAQIASGQLTMYDGAAVYEQNFHIYPNSAGAAVGTSGSIAVSENALYGYIYVYEWIDNQGQVHRSFPSPVVNPLASGESYTFASGTTNGSVSLDIPPLTVTNKSISNVAICIYRTLANGSIYYKVTSFFASTTNTNADGSIGYLDTVPDGAIQGNTELYTNGAQGYFAPPATAALIYYKNRLMAVPYEGGYDFLYSNETLPNFPVQFVPYFDQNIGTVGGPLVTGINMDDKLILFKSGVIDGPSIYYLVGNGPAPSGAGNDFTDPLPINVDVGNVNRTSVVRIPEGIMFKTDKGIFILDRGLNPSYIGAPVEAYNQYSVLTAIRMPNATQVRFFLSNGTMLIYDYFYKKWATATPPAGISDCVFQGLHTYVSSSGVVYQETPSTYVDGASTPVLMNFTTAWIKLAGLQGYQRAYFYYLLGEYLSPHQLQLNMYYDFSSVSNQTTTITPNSANFLENWRIFLAKQRCQSFQLSLQEVYTGTPGAGFTMSGINLIAGVKSSFRTISSAETTA